MKQPFAGEVPPEAAEVLVLTVWPTIGATKVGRWVGRMAAVRFGIGEFFTLGKLLAAATIPVSLAVFAWQFVPHICRRYLLTNRRLMIRRGWVGSDDKWITLDEFDAIDIEVLPGQQWLRAGEVVFRRSGSEVLRFSGVSRPEVFRQSCLKVRSALLSVRQVLREQMTA
jgi:hypothetical protein